MRLLLLALLLAISAVSGLRLSAIASHACACCAAAALLVAPPTFAAETANAPVASRPTAALAGVPADAATRVGGRSAIIATPNEANTLKTAADRLALPADLPADSDLAKFLADDAPSTSVSSPRDHS